jgi:hypothetical protein
MRFAVQPCQAEGRGLLRAFGRARQLPKQQYSIEDLRLNK